MTDNHRVVSVSDNRSQARLANAVSWACTEAKLDADVVEQVTRLALEYAQAQGLLMVQRQSK